MLGRGHDVVAAAGLRGGDAVQVYDGYTFPLGGGMGPLGRPRRPEVVSGLFQRTQVSPVSDNLPGVQVNHVALLVRGQGGVFLDDRPPCVSYLGKRYLSAGSQLVHLHRYRSNVHCWPYTTFQKKKMLSSSRYI